MMQKYSSMSAAGEHFARKKDVKAADKVKQEEVVVKKQSDEERFQHLSAAGEHFARMKSEKKSEKVVKMIAADSSSSDDEVDEQNLSGVSGASDSAKCWGIFGRNRGSKSEDKDEASYEYLSPNGKHFATANAKNIKVEKVESRKKIDNEEEKETEGSLLGNSSSQPFDMNSVSALDSSIPSADKIDTSQDDPAARVFLSADEFSDSFVQEISTSNNSYGKEFDHAVDALDGVFNVMDMEEKCNFEMSPTQSLPTLTAEEKEMESKDLPSSSAASTTATLPQVDKIQRMPAYTLHRDLIIGKGSYGHVCVASRGETEGYFSSKPGRRKKYACKSVSLTGLDPKHICKLQEEVNVLRVLRGHKNVIRLYDVFVVDTELLIITELGTGGDLFHLLSTHPKHGFSEEYAGKIH